MSADHQQPPDHISVPSCQRDPHLPPYHRASAIRTCLRTIVPARSAPATVPSCQRDPHLPPYHRVSAIRTCHRTIVPARSAPASVPSCKRDTHLPRPIVFAFARVPPQGGEWIKGRRPCVGPGWVQLYCAFSPVLSLQNPYTVASQPPLKTSMSNCKNMPRTNWMFPALSNTWIHDFSRAQLRASSTPRLRACVCHFHPRLGGTASAICVRAPLRLLSSGLSSGSSRVRPPPPIERWICGVSTCILGLYRVRRACVGVVRTRGDPSMIPSGRRGVMRCGRRDGDDRHRCDH